MFEQLSLAGTAPAYLSNKTIVTSLHLLKCALCAMLTPGLRVPRRTDNDHCAAASPAAPSLWKPLQLRYVSFDGFNTVIDDVFVSDDGDHGTHR